MDICFLGFKSVWNTIALSISLELSFECMNMTYDAYDLVLTVYPWMYEILEEVPYEI